MRGSDERSEGLFSYVSCEVNRTGIVVGHCS